LILGEQLVNAKQQLVSKVDHPQLEAEILLAFVLSKPRSYLFAYPEQQLSNEQIQQLSTCLKRRLDGEPMAYILGKREFWSLELIVTPDVLIPRPETELLVETVLACFPADQKNIYIADLGTGSGAIALALAHERPFWKIVATDVSEKALSIAVKNVQQLGLNNISFCLGNWCTALPDKQFDVIVSNPPYISKAEWGCVAEGLAFEPQDALLSEDEGLADIALIVKSAQQSLKPDGWLLIEHGWQQGKNVRELFIAAGYKAVETKSDLAGQERITLGMRSRFLV